MKKFINIFQQNKKFNLLALQDLVENGDVQFLEKKEIKTTYPNKTVTEYKEKYNIEILKDLGYSVNIESNKEGILSILVFNCNTETYSLYRQDKLSDKNLEIFNRIIDLLRKPKNNKYNKFNILIPLFKNIKLQEINNFEKEVEGKIILTKEYAVQDTCSLGSLFLSVDIIDNETSILRLNLHSRDSEENEWIINLFDGEKCPKINVKLFNYMKKSSLKKEQKVS